MKKICWLATGGTIASRPSENGLVPGFTAKEMLEMVPNLNDYGHIDCYDTNFLLLPYPVYTVLRLMCYSAALLSVLFVFVTLAVCCSCFN